MSIQQQIDHHGRDGGQSLAVGGRFVDRDDRLADGQGDVHSFVAGSAASPPGVVLPCKTCRGFGPGLFIRNCVTRSPAVVTHGGASRRTRRLVCALPGGRAAAIQISRNTPCGGARALQKHSACKLSDASERHSIYLIASGHEQPCSERHLEACSPIRGIEYPR